MAPPANMDIFNAPSREFSCVRRDRTNTPLQALVTMNDPQFIEAARNLAQHAIKQGGGDAAKAFEVISARVLCRPLREGELLILEASLADLIGEYRTNAANAEALVAIGETEPDPAHDKPTLAAWTMLCNQLMNLDEVLNK